MNNVQELAGWIEQHLVSLSMGVNDTYTMEYLDDDGVGPYRVTGETLLDCVRLAQEAMDLKAR